MTARVVVVGSFNMDLVAYMARMPRPGETLSGQRFITGPGGKGSNQAVAAARLGAEVTFIGRVGGDVFADSAFRFLQGENILTEHVSRDPERATGVASIWVDEHGENSIVVMLGANLGITRADIDSAAAAIARADVLVTQLEVDYDIVQYALHTARGQGVRTILNPAPAGPVSPETVALADIVTPNETELQTLTGAQGGFSPDTARRLLTRPGQTAVVTLGAQGAHWVTADSDALVPTFPVKPVDTTGAGDAFNGALAVALAEGKPLADAIGFANAAAALSVTRPGASQAMALRAEVDAFLAGR